MFKSISSIFTSSFSSQSSSIQNDFVQDDSIQSSSIQNDSIQNDSLLASSSSNNFLLTDSLIKSDNTRKNGNGNDNRDGNGNDNEGKGKNKNKNSSTKMNSFTRVKKEILHGLNEAYKLQRSKNRKKKYWIFKEPDEFNMIKNRQFKTNLLEVVDVLQKAFINKLSWREVIKESLAIDKVDLATYISAMKDFLIQNRIKCAYLTKMYIHKFCIDYVQNVIYFNVYTKEELSSVKLPRVFFKNVLIDELINQVTVKTNLK